MLKLVTQRLDRNIIAEGVAVDGEGRSRQLFIYDVTTREGGELGPPQLTGEDCSYNLALILEGHDYYACTDDDKPKLAVSFSCRQGELYFLQEDDFAKAVEIIGGLLRDTDRPNLQLMSLSPWNLDRAVAAAVAAEEAAGEA